jgi:hypothetical protein
MKAFENNMNCFQSIIRFKKHAHEINCLAHIHGAVAL